MTYTLQYKELSLVQEALICYEVMLKNQLDHYDGTGIQIPELQESLVERIKQIDDLTKEIRMFIVG